MRKLAGIVVAVAVLWCGWWALGAWAAGRAVDRLSGGAEQGAAQGAGPGVGRVSVAGFPFDWRLRLEAVVLTDPETGTVVRLPTLGVRVPAWMPLRADLDLPGRWQVTTPLQNVEIRTEAARGRAAVRVTGALDRVTLRLGAFGLSSSLGWTAEGASGRLDIAQDREPAALAEGSVEGSADVAAVVSVAADIDGIVLRQDGRDAALDLGPVRVAGGAELDAPLSVLRRAARPQPRSLTLDARAEGGASMPAVALSAAGGLRIDAAGVADGRIVLRLDDWRAAYGTALAAGAIAPGFERTVEGMLGGLSGLTPDRDVVEVPLIFSGGRMSFGPFPLGRAPVFRLP